MAGDKKNVGGKLRLVLLRGVGRAIVTADFDQHALGTMLEDYDNGSGSGR
jgi:3-dehydroquinate synthase